MEKYTYLVVGTNNPSSSQGWIATEVDARSPREALLKAKLGESLDGLFIEYPEWVFTQSESEIGHDRCEKTIRKKF